MAGSQVDKWKAGQADGVGAKVEACTSCILAGPVGYPGLGDDAGRDRWTDGVVVGSQW